MWKWFKWVLLGIGILIIFGVVLAFLRPGTTEDNTQPPQFIQMDFIDLDRIVAISKFRSNSGHDFSSGDETCRSMKHYFNVQVSQEGERLRSQNKGMPPPPDGKTDIKIMSPVDGKVVSIKKEQTLGGQIYIEPTNAPQYTIRLFHIYELDGIKEGSKVTAGQQIGVIGQYQNTDIAIESKRGFKPGFISYFEVMPDSVFAAYQAKGVKDRNELVITKEYRDAHPLECNGEQFAVNYDQNQTPENFVFLPGYNSSL